MCGISGIVFNENQNDLTKYYKAHNLLNHRGPDDEGFLYVNSKNAFFAKGDKTISFYNNQPHIKDIKNVDTVLGHKRLSIIDLSHLGHQPMFFNDWAIIFNGEIFNYLEIRETLKNSGFKFDSETDTEVFLKAFSLWGVESFSKFNGMWAAALYNVKDRNLILTRDRFGIKPLYYHQNERGFYFGSEIKFITPFLTHLYLNENVAYDYLRYSYLEHNNETFIKGIYSLEKGTYLTLKNKQVRHKRFYFLKAVQNDINKILSDSINLRMRSDVEVGSLLSGGIDSSSLVGLVKKYFPKKIIKTFTADFKESKFSEKNYVEKTLKITGHEGNFIKVSYKDFENSFDDFLKTREAPPRSMSVVLEYLLFKFIKNNSNAKVIFSGQGADEIFTGYTKHLYIYLGSLLLRLKLIKFISELVSIKKNKGIGFFKILKNILLELSSEIFGDFRFRKKRGFKNNLNKRFSFNLKFNLLKSSLKNGINKSALQEYLTNNDKNSMRFSIEVRVPFLDYRLVEATQSLNEDSFINKGVTKKPLRDISSGLIHSDILQRKDKMGFITPQEIWQKKEMKEKIDQSFKFLIENKNVKFLNYTQISNIYNDYQKNKFLDWTFIWRIYCLNEFIRVWKVKS